MSFGTVAFGAISGVWLTHASDTPERVVINWLTDTPAPTTVKYGADAASLKTAGSGKIETLHRAEVEYPKDGAALIYEISDESGRAERFTANPYPQRKGVLKVVFIGNLGYAPDPNFSAIAADKPNLIITCGDNVANLHEKGNEGIGAYKNMIAKFPRALVSSTPVLTALGNHDKEILPRGKKYPPHPSYDVSASTYREFFNLPQDEWKWEFSIPTHNARFIALDLCHTSDFGTTWQACSPFDADSEQFGWYAAALSKKGAPRAFTIINERNAVMRTVLGGIWRPQFEKNAAVVSGFGYYLERAEQNVPYFNTSLCAGTKYPDAFSKFIRAEAGYLLLTFNPDGSVRAELKSISGEVLDASSL